MEKCKVDFDALSWQSPREGARFKVFQQGNRRLRMLEFSRGFVEPDWCLNGHIGYVLEGTMDVDFNGDLVHFSAGDGVFVPAGQENKHKVKVTTDKVRLILVEDA
jgi:quercetin dioxygenase-like cupin family protein